MIVQTVTDLIGYSDQRVLTPRGQWVKGELRDAHANRAGIAKLVVVRRSSEERDGLVYNNVVAAVETTSEFIDDDYVVVRTQWFTEGKHCASRVRSSYRHLLGRVEPWMRGVEMWKQWVTNSAVQESAREHILRYFSSSETMLRKNGFNDMEQEYQHWEFLAQWILDPRDLDDIVHKTRCGKMSALSVKAMPLRIALRLEGWNPPQRMPRTKPRKNQLLVPLALPS